MHALFTHFYGQNGRRKFRALKIDRIWCGPIRNVGFVVWKQKRMASSVQHTIGTMLRRHFGEQMFRGLAEAQGMEESHRLHCTGARLFALLAVGKSAFLDIRGLLLNSSRKTYVDMAGSRMALWHWPNWEWQALALGSCCRLKGCEMDENQKTMEKQLKSVWICVVIRERSGDTLECRLHTFGSGWQYCCLPHVDEKHWPSICLASASLTLLSGQPAGLGIFPCKIYTERRREGWWEQELAYFALFKTLFLFNMKKDEMKRLIGAKCFVCIRKNEPMKGARMFQQELKLFASAKL